LSQVAALVVLVELLAVVEQVEFSMQLHNQ
jgi:hypothetical protein